jgi:hypothetical protein
LKGRKTDCDNVGHSYRPKHAVFSSVTVMERSLEYSSAPPAGKYAQTACIVRLALFSLHVIAADDRAATMGYHRTPRREPMNDGHHARAIKRARTPVPGDPLRDIARRGMCRDSNGGV